MNSIDDSSPAQKPGFDVPCPTREQGCDSSQQDRQTTACRGSSQQGMTPIEEKLLAIARTLPSRSGLDRLDTPDWLSNSFAWEQYVPDGIRDSWHCLSLESRLAIYLFSVQSLSSDDGFD